MSATQDEPTTTTTEQYGLPSYTCTPSPDQVCVAVGDLQPEPASATTLPPQPDPVATESVIEVAAPPAPVVRDPLPVTGSGTSFLLLVGIATVAAGALCRRLAARLR